jgi:hypothetical protein
MKKVGIFNLGAASKVFYTEVAENTEDAEKRTQEPRCENPIVNAAQ